MSTAGIEGEGGAVRQRRDERQDNEGEGGASGGDDEGRGEMTGDVEGCEDVRWQPLQLHGTRM